jgi:hypothetical protein
MIDPIYLNIFVKYIVLYFISRNIQKPDQVFFAVSLLDAVVFARRSLENFGLDDFP